MPIASCFLLARVLPHRALISPFPGGMGLETVCVWRVLCHMATGLPLQEVGGVCCRELRHSGCSFEGGLRPHRMGWCWGRNGNKGWRRLVKESTHMGCFPHKACSLHLVNIQECMCGPGRLRHRAGQTEGTHPSPDRTCPKEAEVAWAGH